MSANEARVYVLDDDPSFVRSTVRLLESWGLLSQAFTSPAELLAQDLDRWPACLIIDLRMPGMSGLEVQRALSARRRKLPVIFVSGHADVQSGVAAMKLGAIDFFTKPVDEEQLIAAVDRAIEQDVRTGVEQRRAGYVRALLERLAPEERRICDLVIDGRRDDQIAVELGWTEEQVRASRSKAMEALSVASVVEFVRVLEAVRST
jgi:FixJ family two-component response regulator